MLTVFPRCFDARAAILSPFHHRLVAAFQVTVLGVFWTVLGDFGGLERCVCKDFLGKLFGDFWDGFKMVLGLF